jgi:hypothetical protein
MVGIGVGTKVRILVMDVKGKGWERFVRRKGKNGGNGCARFVRRRRRVVWEGTYGKGW